MTPLEVVLEQTFQEAASFSRAGACYSSVQRLGGILNVVTKRQPSLRLEWEQRLRAADLSYEAVDDIRVGLEKDAHRLRQILQVGDHWNDDEITLILTVRIEMDLVCEFLRFRGYEADCAYGDIDAKIGDLRKSKRNRPLFESVKSVVARNWGLPLESRWLNEGPP